MLDTSTLNSAILEQLHAALAQEGDKGLSDWAIQSSRNNPTGDLTQFLKHAVENRVTYVGNRRYQTRLMAIPLVGVIDRPLHEFSCTKQMMVSAKEQGMLSANDGLVILNVALTRTFLQDLTIKQLYQIAPRLFARGAQQTDELVIDMDPAHSNKTVNSALMLALVYWRVDTKLPKLMTDPLAREKFGALVGNFLSFERADKNGSKTIWGCPIMPFFKATESLTRMTVKNALVAILGTVDPNNATNPIMHIEIMEEGIDAYRILMSAEVSGKHLDNACGILIDELCDGPITTLLKEIVDLCNAHSPSFTVKQTYRASTTHEDDHGNQIVSVAEVIVH